MAQRLLTKLACIVILMSLWMEWCASIADAGTDEGSRITASVLNSDQIVNGTAMMVGDTPIHEISGLSHNNNGETPIFYGISDSIGVEWPKVIYKFPIDIDGTDPSLTETITGITMEQPPIYSLKWADTENVVYLKDGTYEFFIIATEGYREFGTFTNFWLYGSDGSYIGNLSYNTTIFQEMGPYDAPTTGFGEGDGVEAMSATSDYSKVIFIGSNTLVQDTGCDSCVRISVNTLAFSGNANAPTWLEDYQFRYDKDSVDTTVTDGTIVEDDLSIVLILEKTEDITLGTFDIKLYSIDLSLLGTDSDIKGCAALTSSCRNLDTAVDKTLVASFTDLLSDIADIDSIDFDAIAKGPDDLGEKYCAYTDTDYTGYFLMIASDNNEIDDTYFAYLCLKVKMTILAEETDGAAIQCLAMVILTVIVAVIYS